MKEIEDVLYLACSFKKVSVEEVAIAVQNGADTVEKNPRAYRSRDSLWTAHPNLRKYLELKH